jgi:hypothetical protein
MGLSAILASFLLSLTSGSPSGFFDLPATLPANEHGKKKTTKHFSMDRILKGEFCGVCHLTVVFPMNDCKRCHTNHSSIPE